MDLINWDPDSDPIVIFGVVYDAYSLRILVSGFVRQHRNLDDGMLRAASRLKESLSNIYVILKEARKLITWDMTPKSRCDMDHIISCGEQFIESIENEFGRLAKNLGFWITNSDRFSKLIKRVLGEDNQEDILQSTEEVRDWSERYDRLVKRMYGYSRRE